MADKRKPWLKWYTRDWRSNPKLRICSYAARGFWADLISLMAEAEHYGFLLIGGLAPTCRHLAGILGGSEKDVAKLRNELAEAGVFSITGTAMPADVEALIPETVAHGVIFSRRMVRDKAKADADAANGKGGGNPKLREPDKQGVNPPANPQRSEGREQISEAKASGGKPPEDPVKLLFDAGVELLTANGCKEPNARSLIGKWRKDCGDSAVMAAIAEARKLSVSEPLSWLSVKLANKPRETWDQRRIREGQEALNS